MNALRVLSLPVVRFGVVAVAGLVVDLSIAWALAALAGVPLPLAALAGFLCAAAFNYLLHEVWTFGGGGSPSAGRGALYLLVLGLTLGVRVGSVAALEMLRDLLLPGAGWRLPVLVLATGLSFATNYLLSRTLVFRRPEKDAR